jgi:hypothetical protein
LWEAYVKNVDGYQSTESFACLVGIEIFATHRGLGEEMMDWLFDSWMLTERVRFRKTK